MAPEIVVRHARKTDFSSVVALLAAAQLPPDDAASWIDHFVVAERDGEVVGAAGLELYGDSALLRSVVTANDVRGTGTGAALTNAAIEWARAMRIESVYLLTTSAGDWFPRFGFERITRDDVPAEVKASVQFQLVTCSTATVMRRKLT